MNTEAVQRLDKPTVARKTMPVCVVTGIILLLPFIGTSRLAAQGCQPVDDALKKIFTTPTHLYNTMDGDRKNELIYTSGAIYENRHGKWATSQVTLQQVMMMEEKNRQSSRTSCQYLHDEAVNGEMAAVYSTHAERTDMGLKSDGQIWISKISGLPLRHEEIFEQGSNIKSHLSTRYEYANVRAPL